MTSLAISRESPDSPPVPTLSLAPQTAVTDTTTISNGNSTDIKLSTCPELMYNKGIAVTVTHCPVDSSSPDNTIHPPLLDSSGQEMGLSSLSLDVLTSGEHLDMLSLSSYGSGHDSEGEKQSLVSGDLDSTEGPIEQALHQTSNDESRSSSSMGYLEPRPSSQSPKGDQNLSPRDIQKKLMEKMNCLTTTEEEGKASERMNKKGVGSEGIPATTLPGRSHSLTTSNKLSIGALFRRKNSLVRSGDRNPQTLAATSTTGLILHDRPKTLPAKSPEEEHRHQRLHQQMMVAARKKDLQKAKEEVKKEKMKRERDKLVADSLKEWEKILPKWETVHTNRKVRDLWWQGLPPGIRGTVWKKAIGNDLHVSSDLYVINLRRCRERLAIARERSDSSTSHTSLSREHSVEVIHLDVLRTFPTLGFFQEGGPYNKPLHDVLGAYACYRPDIGYVQGMSFLAGVLLLNMDAGDAFVCLANLLNLPSYLAFFKVDHILMQPYFNTFNVILQDTIPKLSAHFSSLQFSPEYYLIEWIFTIYTRALPLDVACRVWDMFCRDGDSFLFRTALGILKMFQVSLLGLRSIEELGHFLGKLPVSIESDHLFVHIESIHFTTKRFKQILSHEKDIVATSESH